MDKARLSELNLWEGDRIFYRLLEEEYPFFSLKLEYKGDKLVRWSLDGEEKYSDYGAESADRKEEAK